MSYTTDQKRAFQTIIDSFGEAHFSAAAVHEEALKRGLKLSETSVYRRLEEAVAEGRLLRIVIDNKKSACYQRVGGERCHEHAHMVCERCGKLIHLECKEIDELAAHLESHHSFHLDKSRTAFYGLCEECAKQ